MKKICALCLSVLLCLGLMQPALAQTFRDVPASHWAAGVVDEMTGRGIVQGVGDGRFNPSGDISIAEFCAMLTRMVFPQALDETAAAAPWWAPYVSAADDAGLLAGTTALLESGGWDEAALESAASRCDMAQMLYNLLIAAGIPLPEEDALRAARAAIPDYDAIPARCRTAVETMYALGCLQGTGVDGAFSPQAHMDRASACAVLSRLLSLVEDAAAEHPAARETALQIRRGEVLRRINAERTQAGLNPLRLDAQVCDYAQLRAEEITENFSHTRPNGQNYWTALGELNIPYYPGGENISAGRESAADVMDGWMNSPGHRANILREGIGSVGIGYVRTQSGYGHYWVQVFVP